MKGSQANLTCISPLSGKESNLFSQKNMKASEHSRENYIMKDMSRSQCCKGWALLDSCAPPQILPASYSRQFKGIDHFRQVQPDSTSHQAQIECLSNWTWDPGRAEESGSCSCVTWKCGGVHLSVGELFPTETWKQVRKYCSFLPQMESLNSFCMTSR